LSESPAQPPPPPPPQEHALSESPAQPPPPPPPQEHALSESPAQPLPPPPMTTTQTQACECVTASDGLPAFICDTCKISSWSTVSRRIENLPKSAKFAPAVVPAVPDKTQDKDTTQADNCMLEQSSQCQVFIKKVKIILKMSWSKIN